MIQRIGNYLYFFEKIGTSIVNFPPVLFTFVGSIYVKNCVHYDIVDVWHYLDVSFESYYYLFVILLYLIFREGCYSF